MKSSTKIVLAGAATITVLSAGVGIGSTGRTAGARAAAAAGAAGARTLSGVSGGVIADAGSQPSKPAAPAKARTVSTAPAPAAASASSTPAPAKAKKGKTSGSSGSGSVAPVALSGDQPGAGNTGVPAGTALTVMYGDLTITTAGATYSGLDIHGFVTVEAPNVTIKDSIIRGGSATSQNALVYDVSNTATNFLIEDSEIVPAYPSVYLDGIDGWNYTALRDNVHGSVAGLKMFGPNATVQDSWIHGLVTYPHDPNQGGGRTHNDDVQILSGTNLKIIGNTMEGGRNTALMITQDQGTTNNVVFDNNWVSGGACSVNMTPKPLGSLNAITLDNNIFTDNSTNHCPILDTTRTHLTATGNVFAGTGLPVPVNNNGNNN